MPRRKRPPRAPSCASSCVPARWTIPCSFALACLAAVGCDRLFDPLPMAPWSRFLRRARFALAALVVAAVVANVVVFAFPEATRGFADWWVASRRVGRPGAQSAEWYRRALSERWIPNVRASISIFGPATGLPLALGAAALGALAAAPRLGRTFGVALLIAVVIGDLWLQNHGLDLNAAVDREALEAPAEVVRFFRGEPANGQRIYAWWGGGGRGPGESGASLAREFARGDRQEWLRGLKEMLPMDAAALWDVPLFNAHSPTWLAPQERAVDEIEGAKPKRLSWPERFARLRAALPLLRASSIRYMLSPVDVEMAGVRERARIPTLGGAFVVRVYELDDAMPRAYWVPRLRAAADEEALWRELVSPSFDPRAEALTVGTRPQGDEAPAATTTAGDGTTVTAVEERPTLRVYRIDAPRAGIFVFNESRYPGWSAAVNDRDEPLLAVNGMFQGVRVGAGSSIVRFVFHPHALERGAWIALAAAAGAIVACALAPRGPRA